MISIRCSANRAAFFAIGAADARILVDFADQKLPETGRRAQKVSLA